MLTERHSAILKAIVTSHIETGDPVGSRAVSKRAQLNLSPATIRSAMADLADLGLLSQPHTSAGRLPTEQGIRLYVEDLLERVPLTVAQEERILSACERGGEEMDQVLEEVARAFAGMTNYLGLAVGQNLETAVFARIQLWRIDAKRVVALLVSQSGQVRNRVLHLVEPKSQRALTEIGRRLSHRLEGLTLLAARAALEEEMAAEFAEFEVLREMLVANLFTSFLAAGLIVNGQMNLLGFPELTHTDRMRELMIALEEKERFIHLLNECLDGDEVHLFIGSDTHCVRGCSVVAAKFTGQGDQPAGSLGVLGPMRLDYGQVIPMVEFAAQTLSRLFAR